MSKQKHNNLTPKKKIRVLWFCNTPANAGQFLNYVINGSGGWLNALDQSIQNCIELHVAFYGKADNSFKYKNTQYHSIKNNSSLVRRFLNRAQLFSLDLKRDIEKYIQIVNSVKPDLIHIHGTENSFGGIIANTDIPVVLSIQGIITIIYHKYCSGIEKKYLKIKDRKRAHLKDYFFPWSFNVVYRLFKKMSQLEIEYLKLTKYIIGRTSWDFRVSRLLAPNSIYYRGDEILRDSFYHHKWEPHFSDKLFIHSTISNTFYKGFETLCMALSELNKIGFRCEWTVAGISTEDLIVKVTKRKLRNNYPPKGLILLGSINEKSLINKLLRADVYVMPSHIDNSPNGLCEAMILGIPCISTFVGGVGSLMKDGQEGVFFQDGDYWALAGALLEMRKNFEKSIQLGLNARATALVRHNKHRVVNELLNTYLRIIKTHKTELEYSHQIEK